MGAHWPKAEFESLKKSALVAETRHDLLIMHCAAGYTNRTEDAIQKKLYKEKFNEVIYIKYLSKREFVGGDIKDLILKVKEYNIPFDTFIKDANIIVELANTIKRDPHDVLNKLTSLKVQFEAHEIASEIAVDISKKNIPTIPDAQPSIDKNTQLQNILISTIKTCNPKLMLGQIQALALTLLKADELTVTGYGSDTTIAVFIKNK